MKANAPEKIYLFENPISNEPDDRWLSKRSDDNDIEYIRKDAFIEKACDWLADNYSKYIITNGLATIFRPTIDFDTIRMIENFKKAMED